MAATFRWLVLHCCSRCRHKPTALDTKGETTACGVTGKVVKFFCLTAGLLLLNIGYLLLGAVIFSHLEKYNEEHTCFTGAENFARAENAAVSLLMEVSADVATGRLRLEGSESSPGYEVVAGDFTKILRAFSLSVIDIGYNVTRNCSQLGKPNGPQYRWSLEGSIMFAMTVTTTIGYGVLAPETTSGRVVCIAYAMIGIPMMITCLANIGEVMAHVFRYLYAAVCCCGCCRPKRKKNVLPVAMRISEHGAGGGSGGRGGRGPIYDSVFDDFDDPDENEEDKAEEEEEITVPLTISMIVLLVFTFFGAALFAAWEGWNYVDATYFCFVTYSTIGFGDIVPGTRNLDSPQSQAQLIVTSIYQIVGMAMLSMCFQLMQDEMVAKFKWLGQKCSMCRGHLEEDE